ncbi:pterin 4 alpha carbinolamine dehydratase-domain-containing protein, partial [Trichophaea hybrida]
SQTASLAAALLVEGGGKWHLTSTRKGLEREFHFKTFKKTWDFMNIVASKSGKERHHPEWSNVYNRVFIRWTTHSPPGLGSQDVQMAQFCDQQGKALGEL